MQLFIRNAPYYEPVIGYVTKDEEPNGILTHTFHVLNKNESLALTSDDVDELIPFDIDIYNKMKLEYFFNLYKGSLERIEKKLKEYQND